MSSFFRYRLFCNAVLLTGAKILSDSAVGSTKMKQQINLKFLVKYKKSQTECFKLLNEVYGDDVMSTTRVFERYKCFESGRDEVEDDPRSGRPSTTNSS